MKRFRRLAIALSFILLVSVFSPLLTLAAEPQHDPWDCPEPGCGRKGNRGNYCGNCGHPAPWIQTPTPKPTPSPRRTATRTPVKTPTPTPKPTPSPRRTATRTPTRKPTATPKKVPINVTSTIYKRGGNVEIKWTGGTTGKAIRARVYHWFNEQRNKGVNHYLVQSTATLSGNKGTISGLVPGQRYWIELTDTANSGNVAWVDFQTPKGARPAATFTLKNLNGNYNKNSDYLVVSPEFTVSGLSGKKDFKYLFVLILPNGDLLPSYRTEWTAYNGTWYFPDGYTFLWNDIVQAYGSIPTGSYMLEFLVDDYIVGMKRFTVQ